MRSPSFRISGLLAQIGAEFERQHERHENAKRELQSQVEEMRRLTELVEEMQHSFSCSKEKYNQDVSMIRREIEAVVASNRETHDRTTDTGCLNAAHGQLPVDYNAKMSVNAPSTTLDSQDVHHGGLHAANWLINATFDTTPPQYQQVEGDWHAIFNPCIPRTMKLSLLHTVVHDSVVCCVRFSRDGRYMATGSDRSVHIFDVSVGAKLCSLAVTQGAESYIRSLCFSSDGNRLATGSEDALIRVWDIQAKVIHMQLTGHDQEIYAVEYANNGRTIVSGSSDTTVRLWDARTGINTRILTAGNGITSVSVSANLPYIAASSFDATVYIWDMQSGQLISQLAGRDGHKDSAYCTAFSPNGREIVTGGLDKDVKIWELTAGTTLPGKVKTLHGHADFVVSIGVTPDARWILSGSKDRSLVTWDAETGIPQFMLHGHSNTVLSVAATADCFATAGGDKVARIWSFHS